MRKQNQAEATSITTTTTIRTGHGKKKFKICLTSLFVFDYDGKKNNFLCILDENESH
jgi:hypothetical protein